MINTILVEDDLYIQKHFAERLKSNEIFRLVGVYRDAFDAERNCNSSIQLILMDVQTQHKHSGLAAAKRIKKGFSKYQNSNRNLACRPAGIGTSKDRCSRQPVV